MTTNFCISVYFVPLFFSCRPLLLVMAGVSTSITSVSWSLLVRHLSSSMGSNVGKVGNVPSHIWRSRSAESGAGEHGSQNSILRVVVEGDVSACDDGDGCSFLLTLTGTLRQNRLQTGPKVG